MPTPLTIEEIRRIVVAMYDDTQDLEGNAYREDYKNTPYYDLDQYFVEYMERKCSIMMGLIAGFVAFGDDEIQKLFHTKITIYDVLDNIRKWKKACGQ